jgi:hypothetical protein
LKSTLCLFAVLMLAAPAAAAPAIAPHRAIYDLSLLRANEGASLQSASGRLAFEIEGSSCDGYTVSFRMAARYRPKEGAATLIDTMTTSYEGPGALDFQHQITERIDGTVRDDHRVKMTRATPEAAGEGTISSKPGDSFTIPAGTLLPMQHQMRLMALGGQAAGAIRASSSTAPMRASPTGSSPSWARRSRRTASCATPANPPPRRWRPSAHGP